MTTQTPVAFLIYNRPETTARVFTRIREARPRTLLIVGDGARADVPGDAEAVKAAQAAVAAIDWPCERLVDFSPANLGCRRRVSSGLNWVFSQVPEAIVLEDDCLPHPTFFPYCDELIDRYRDDDRIFAVSGDCFLDPEFASSTGYYFSKYMHCWGWATWRRAWAHYDVNMGHWPRFLKSGALQRFADSRTEARFWQRAFADAYAGRLNTWDYQLSFAAIQHDGLVVLPRTNLVSNIGFGCAATHTHNACHPLANLPTSAISLPLEHPARVERNRWADNLTFHQVYRGRRPGIRNYLTATVRKWRRSLSRRLLAAPRTRNRVSHSATLNSGQTPRPGELNFRSEPASAVRRPLTATSVSLP